MHLYPMLALAHAGALVIRPNVIFTLVDDWGSFDAFYFYNPFVENLFGGRERIDRTVDLAPARYERDMALTRARLMEARVGTRVVTYHGPRAGLPWGYELCDFEPCGSDVLELWVKVK